MAYSQHRYLNPSEPKLHWPDAMPMRASMVPLPMFNYNWPSLQCNTPYPWSRNIGGVYGLGGILDWFPGFGPAAGGISDTLGYIKIVAMVVGGLALGYAGGFLYRELRTENRGRRGRRGARRRNGGQYEVGITSQHRYRASASERRLWGGSTVTEFLIEDPNFEGSARWNKVMGYGPSPGERRTDALRRYSAKVGQAVAGKAKPRPFQGSLTRNGSDILAQLKAAGGWVIRYSDAKKLFGPGMDTYDRPRWSAYVDVFGHDLYGEGHTKNEAVAQALRTLPANLARHFK